MKKYKSRSQGKRKSLKANTIHLTRIIHYLEEIKKPVVKSQITRDTFIVGAYVENALKWLVGYGLIKKKKEKQGIWEYFIKVTNNRKGGKT